METVKVIRKSFKFRIYPSKAQTKTLEMTLELCRELYNAALQERRDAWKLNRVSVSYFDQSRQLPEIKKHREDLNLVYSEVLQNILRRTDKTFRGFFRRMKRQTKAGYPRFKSQSRFNSFRYPQNGFSLTDNKLSLSKIGKLKIKLSRNVTGKVKTCEIKRENNRWFVIFSVETFSETLPKTDNSIGIDVGINSFAALSNGEIISNERFSESLQNKVRVAQRRVSRRKKGSNRRYKAVSQMRKIYQKIFNQRDTFQHKLSTKIIAENDLTAVEKLNIKGLAKGNLSKQVLDASWSSFFHKLKYKAENAGRELIEVKPHGTSQTCICGANVPKTLSVRVHNCVSCGLVADRDFVSAQVILQRAQVERSNANVSQ